VIHQLSVFEQIGSAFINTSRFVFFQEDKFDEPNIFRPVLKNANEAVSMSIDYLARLTNQSTGEQIIREASFILLSPKKYGKKLIKIPLLDIPQSQKIYNKIVNTDLEASSLFVDPKPKTQEKSANGSSTTTVVTTTEYIPVFFNNNNISIAGCYYITALDSNANESLTSDTVCADNCPVYQLPNVFTPNGDGTNDFFKPFPYKYIESIDMKIYNRWGNLIFSTTNPEILWDGCNQQSKQPCTDGVYYYICNFTAIKLQGNITENLHGFLQLISSPVNNGGN
jgi:gliding motility-associated-like protein